MYEAILSLFLKSIEPIHRWLSENLVTHIMTFGKEFGTLMILVSAVAFLLVTVYFIMKEAKRLPKRFELETFCEDGKQVVIPELRVNFTTYEAAASFAKFYADLFKNKYKFRILGIKKKI